ncbi:hypothetical protein [Nocardia abscessus]|uniref:hypothetical protein n=1 Tax=Nocardia abscessus TaxID=120957 RepID=UPI0024576C44|nr:hypothetical protein [Nocardia abscessus]
MTVRLLGPAADGPTDAVRMTDLVVGVMLYQTQGLHVAGVGHLALGWVVPFDMVIDAVRYWCVAAGTGGTATVELRKNGTASGNTIASSSASPAVSSPTTASPAASLVTGDRVYVFQTAVNSTKLGTGLAAEIVGHRV